MKNVSSEFIKSKIFVLRVLKVSLFKHVCENKGRELSFRDIRTMSIRKPGCGKYNRCQKKKYPRSNRGNGEGRALSFYPV